MLSSRVPVEAAHGLHLSADQEWTGGGWFGRSCHDPAQVRRAAGEGAAYVTLSPFSATASKPGYGPPVPRSAYTSTGIPVLALGGVDPGNAAAAREAGAHGVAVMGCVMRAVDPVCGRAPAASGGGTMTRGTTAVVLTVAGSDSGGAAGIAADLTTFADLGVHGAVVVTAVTAQDTTSVRAVHAVPDAIVLAQLEAVLGDLPVAAVKTGMLSTPDIVRLVAEHLHALRVPVVVDPVLVATSGALGDEQVARAYVEHLLPVATVITPNADEASALLSATGPPDRMARELARLGPAVVLTGGGQTGTCTDWVAIPGYVPVALAHPAVETTHDHGTGCTFSAAVAVQLAHDAPLITAVRRAATYTAGQLRLSQSWNLGRGRGPIAHTRGEPA